MRAVVSMLTPVLLFACGLYVVRGDPEPPGGPPPRSGEPAWAEAAENLPPVPAATAKADAPPSDPEGRVEVLGVEVEPPRSKAERLLASLRAWAENGSARYPKGLIAEIAGDIEADPETSGIYLDAMDGASPRLSAYLRFAFYSVRAAPLRDRLVASARERDSSLDEVGEIVSDPGHLVVTLRDTNAGKIRERLLRKLGAGLLEDPEIRRTLRLLAESDPDIGVRRRAVDRLGRRDDPETHEFLLEVLLDTARSLKERRAAAFWLNEHEVQGAFDHFVALLERRGEPLLTRCAATAMRKIPEDPRALNALEAVIRSDGMDLQTRKNAVDSALVCERALDPVRREALHSRLFASLQTLAGREDEASAELLTHALCEMAAVSGDVYENDIRLILEHSSSSCFRDRLRAAPELMRFIGRDR
jgi:HEAT repeat protein